MVIGWSIAWTVLVTVTLLVVAYQRMGKMPPHHDVMVAMFIAMSASLIIGNLIGMVAWKDFVISSMLSSLIGLIIGYSAGILISLMAALDGLLAGLMGGLMGAMIGVMMIEYNGWEFFVLFLDLTYGMVALLIFQFMYANPEEPSHFSPKLIFIIPIILLLALSLTHYVQKSTPVNNSTHQHHQH